jgi:transmembrane sensor
MSAQQGPNTLPPSGGDIGEQAAEWYLRLSAKETDADDGYVDALARNAAFREWYLQSPEHLEAFLEICEVNHQSQNLSPGHHLDVEALLASRIARIIPLRNREEVALAAAPTLDRGRPRRLRAAWAAAAAVVAVVVGVLIPALRLPTHELVTGVGEQRTAKLDDGSMVVMNTNTRIAIEYSKAERSIRLLQGEALFVVEHDPQRPFIVYSHNARVRAVGTEFNVRDRKESVDVAVVEGVVQVTVSDSVADGSASQIPLPALSAPNTKAVTRVSAGEVAHVTTGSVVAAHVPTVTDSISWRERRLVFHNATLGEVAAELNRYNRIQIKVDEAVAERPLFKEAVMDVDRPQALILYANKDEGLTVEPDGENWVIRGKAAATTE